MNPLSDPSTMNGRNFWSNDVDTMIRSAILSRLVSLSSSPYFTYPMTTNDVHLRSPLVNPTDMLSSLPQFSRGLELFRHQRLLSHFAFPPTNYPNPTEDHRHQNRFNIDLSASDMPIFYPTNRPITGHRYLAPPIISSQHIATISSSVERTTVDNNDRHSLWRLSQVTHTKPFVLQRPTSIATETCTHYEQHFHNDTKSRLMSATLPIQPYYPSHFMKGTTIELADGSLKPVEELTTEDFIRSAYRTETLTLSTSIVTKIEQKSAGIAILHFAVGETKIQVAVEANVEHPFFVIDQGWSSCNPERSAKLYGLRCKKLLVGDVCISLTHKDDSSKNISSCLTCQKSLDNSGTIRRSSSDPCRRPVVIKQCSNSADLFSPNKRNVDCQFALTNHKRRRTTIDDTTNCPKRKSRSLPPDIETVCRKNPRQRRKSLPVV